MTDAKALCPLCSAPATVQPLKESFGIACELLVNCDSCRTFRLTRFAEYVLLVRPVGRAVLADRARRGFELTGEPIEIDVATVERVAELFRLAEEP